MPECSRIYAAQQIGAGLAAVPPISLSSSSSDPSLTQHLRLKGAPAVIWQHTLRIPPTGVNGWLGLFTSCLCYNEQDGEHRSLSGYKKTLSAFPNLTSFTTIARSCLACDRNSLYIQLISSFSTASSCLISPHPRRPCPSVLAPGP
jgi:hypothetical protein